MVSMNLELKRRHLPKQLLFISLVITALLSSLSLFHAVRYSECSSHFADTDVATLLLPPSLLYSSPAVVSTSLAFKQSYGLFNDIPDQRWELIRQRAHEVHGHILKNPSSKPKVETDSPIIEYLSNQEVSAEESKH
jgi:hypothetical protein